MIKFFPTVLALCVLALVFHVQAGFAQPVPNSKDEMEKRCALLCTRALFTALDGKDKDFYSKCFLAGFCESKVIESIIRQTPTGTSGGRVIERNSPKFPETGGYGLRID